MVYPIRTNPLNITKYLPIEVDFLLATANETTSKPPVEEQFLKAITVETPVQMPLNMALASN